MQLAKDTDSTTDKHASLQTSPQYFKLCKTSRDKLEVGKFGNKVPELKGKKNQK